jgi:hypothetical protein
MKEQGTMAQIWRFVWTVLIIAAAAAVLAAASFWVVNKQQDFTLRAYSDRLFWAGIGLTAIGGFTVVASVGSLYTTGTPSVLTAGADARNAQSRLQDHFSVNSKRYTFIFRMVASGAICLAASALIEVLTR